MIHITGCMHGLSTTGGCAWSCVCDKFIPCARIFSHTYTYIINPSESQNVALEPCDKAVSFLELLLQAPTVFRLPLVICFIILTEANDHVVDLDLAPLPASARCSHSPQQRLRGCLQNFRAGCTSCEYLWWRRRSFGGLGALHNPDTSQKPNEKPNAVGKRMVRRLFQRPHPDRTSVTSGMGGRCPTVQRPGVLDRFFLI